MSWWIARRVPSEAVGVDGRTSIHVGAATGHQIDVGRALHDHVQERLGGGVDKYFDDAIEGHVAFSREGPKFRTHIQVHVGKGMAWESQADHADIHISFNEAVERYNNIPATGFPEDGQEPWRTTPWWHHGLRAIQPHRHKCKCSSRLSIQV